MSRVLDSYDEQTRFSYVDIIPPLEPCGNCGKEIISVWQFEKEQVLVHIDKSMCVKVNNT